MPSTFCSASLVATPRDSRAVITLGLCILVKIVLNALPITAPPRAVTCWVAATMPNSSSNPTPAVEAVLPTRLKASAKSAELTANAASTAANLFVISAEVYAAALYPLITAVSAETESAAFIPEIRVRINASFALLRVSSTPNPCLANSLAASATTAKL